MLGRVIHVVDSSKPDESARPAVLEWKGTVLIVDWGHKHNGYAPLPAGYRGKVPGVGQLVVCKLKEFEVTHRALGHERHERHNEAKLEFLEVFVETEAVEGGMVEE